MPFYRAAPEQQTYQNCVDPVTAADSDRSAARGGRGIIYAGAILGSNNSFVPCKEVVISSRDRGAHWSAPAIAEAFPESQNGTPGVPQVPLGATLYPAPTACDRPWIAVDHSDGTVYFSPSPNGYFNLADGFPPPPPGFGHGKRLITASADQGRTFGPLARIDTNALPGAGGTIDAANAVLAATYASDAGQLVFETSTDHGANWTQHVVPVDTTGRASAPFPPASPVVAADPARPGHFAVAILDAAGTDVAIYQTHDSGSTWARPVLLGEAPQNKRVKPWIAFGPTGVLVAAWRTQYGDGSYDVWASIAADGGGRFTAPIRATQGPAAPYPPYFAIGLGDDMTGLTVGARYAYVGFGDSQSGSTRAALAQVALPLAAAPPCVDRRKFRFKLHHARRARVVKVEVFINGRRELSRRGRDIRSITLRRLPRRVFHVKIVATQSSGSKLISTRTYRGCTKTRPTTHAQR
jgi:hypothetical protein